MPPAHGSVKDAWEGWYDRQGEGDLPVIVEAEIRYVDGEGRETQRRITTRRFGPDVFGEPGECVILARCHLRQEGRTFKVKRIREFVDTATGEVVGDVSSYLRHAYDVSAAGQTARLLGEISDELDVLLYIARASPRLSPKEKAVLVAFLQRAAPGAELDMAMVDVSFSDPPSQVALRRALSMVLEKGRAEALLSDVEALAAARSKMDDFTEAALALVRKRPGRPRSPGRGAAEWAPLHAPGPQRSSVEPPSA